MEYSSSTNLQFPSTTNSSLTPSQSLPLNTQKRKRIISELQRGWKAATKLRRIQVAAGDRTLRDQEIDVVNLLVTIVSSFSNCLSIFSTSFEAPSYSVKGSEVGKPVMMSTKKAKIRRDDHHKPIRKKTELDTTDLTDDGFVWRKYGQKPIRTSAHPRHYYKCTHWDDKKCQATKWVQKVSEEPSLYHTIYSDEHTCRSHLRSLDTSSLPDDQPTDSNFYINFDGRSNLPWTTSTATKDDIEMNQQDIKSSCSRFFSNPSSSSSSSISLPDMAQPKEEHSDGGSSLLAVSSDHQMTQTMSRNTSTYDEDIHQPTTTTMNQYSSDDYYNYKSSVLHDPITTAFSSSFEPVNIEEVHDYYGGNDNVILSQKEAFFCNSSLESYLYNELM